MQEASIGPILRGDDVLIRAGTGSGKTEAAAAPLTERNAVLLGEGAGVAFIFVSPTRALVNDLARRLEPPLAQLNIRVGVRHGERDDLARTIPPDVLITTPESFDILVGKRPSALERVQAVVLDEVHLVHNRQRGLQLAIALHRLELWLDRAIQVIGLSATVAAPDTIWAFFRPGRPVTQVYDPTSRDLAMQIRVNLTHVELATLLSRLQRGSNAKLLVFTNSRRECDAVADALRRESGFGAAVFSHHASLDRDERLRVEAEFQDCRRGICVATSTLELGIDIGDINLVVLYGVPADWQSFLQRVGRGNRRADVAEALCVVPAPTARLPLRVRDELGFQALHFQIDHGAIDTTGCFSLYAAAGQQLVSAIAAEGGGFTGINRLAELTSPWPHLGIDTIEMILDELEARDVLVKHPAYRRYGAGPGLHQLERTRQLWSNFPLGSRDIDVLAGRTAIGKIPASNLLRVREDDVIVFAGRRWSVASLAGDAIRVKPTEAPPTCKLRFGRGGAPLDPGVADQIRALLEAGDVSSSVRPESAAQEIQVRMRDLAPFAAIDVLPFAHLDYGYVYVTFAGRMANQIVAAWAGANPEGAGELTLRASSEIDFSQLPNDPQDLVPWIGAADLPEEQQSEYERLLPAILRRRELVNLWIHHPAHGRVLTRLRAAQPTGFPPELVPLVEG
jgi:ATP-dependent helicase Lhr and Lhr-like helicase